MNNHFPARPLQRFNSNCLYRGRNSFEAPYQRNNQTKEGNWFSVNTSVL
jgi:hypothetical protein